MALKNFRCYQLSVQFYKSLVPMRCPAHLKAQLLRSASSISLNLAEGDSRQSLQDRRRFFVIALGQLRESQAILDLLSTSQETIRSQADRLGANLYRLLHPPSR
jgi:four helix bundle protein